MNTKKIAVGYCRVSTDEQANNGLSLDVQEATCRTAMARDGYEILKIVRDEGKSGGNLNRQGMQEIIELAENNKVHAIYTISSDRVSRNTQEYLFLRDLFRKKGIELRYINQPNIDDSAAGRTIDEVMASFNQLHRLQTSEKVKTTLYAKAEAGYFPEYAPPGYKNIDNPDKTAPKIAQKIIVPDPASRDLITEAFKLFATGNYNGYDLCDLMYEKGLRSRNGGKIPYSRFYSLLRNKFYIGEVHWGKVHVKEGKHEPLIDRETFERVQMIMDGNNYHACRRRKYQWLLNGFVYCHRHQKRYTAEWHLKKGISYYHCTNRSGCGKYIRTEELESLVAKKFQDLEFAPDFVNKVMEKVKAEYYKRREQFDGKKQSFTNQKTALEARRKAAEENLLDKVISGEDFKRINEEIKGQLQNIDRKIFELENGHQVKLDVAQEVLKFTQNLSDSYAQATPFIKRHYLSLFWDRFEVEDGIIITSRPSLLFDELLKLQQIFYRTQETKNLQLLGDSEASNQVIIRDCWLERWDSNPRPTG